MAYSFDVAGEGDWCHACAALTPFYIKEESMAPHMCDTRDLLLKHNTR